MAEREERGAPEGASPEVPASPSANGNDNGGAAHDAPPVKETLYEKLGAKSAEPAKNDAPAFYQFVVFPLIIVGVSVAILGFFRWVAADRRSYDEYLLEISSGWTKKRAEAAYQLQFRMADAGDDLREHADAPKTIAVFEAAAKDQGDPRIRRWLAIVLGQIKDVRAVPTLLAAMGPEEQDPETRVNATWAVGHIRSVSAVPTLVGLLDDPLEAERKTAAFALGDVLSDARDPKASQRAVASAETDETAAKLAALPRAADALALHLSKPGEEVDVRWNAALALSRLGDERAVPTLLAMLDRRFLDSVVGNKGDPMSPRERAEATQSILINALRGVLSLGATSALEKVSALADGEPDLQVRQAAIQVRDELKKKLAAATPAH